MLEVLFNSIHRILNKTQLSMDIITFTTIVFVKGVTLPKLLQNQIKRHHYLEQVSEQKNLYRTASLFWALRRLLPSPSEMFRWASWWCYIFLTPVLLSGHSHNCNLCVLVIPVWVYWVGERRIILCPFWKCSNVIKTNLHLLYNVFRTAIMFIICSTLREYASENEPLTERSTSLGDALPRNRVHVTKIRNTTTHCCGPFNANR